MLLAGAYSFSPSAGEDSFGFLLSDSASTGLTGDVLRFPVCAVVALVEAGRAKTIMRRARAEKRIRRRKWNIAAARQHYKDGKYQLLKCPCEDRKKGGESLSRAEQLAMLKRKFEVKARSDDRAPLEDEILLAKGMKVMLVSNIQTDFDMANGARGTVQDIILDEREADCQESAFERKLQFPPACVLVKLDRMRVHHFGSLSENVVPVFPAESKIRSCLCFHGLPSTGANFRARHRRPWKAADRETDSLQRLCCLIEKLRP